MKGVGGFVVLFILSGPLFPGLGTTATGQNPSQIYAAHKGKVFVAEGGQDISCGVLLPEGYFLTTDSVVGTEGLVLLRKDDVVYKLRPFWRNPMANMALLYPEAVEGYQGMDQQIRQDYFVGAKHTLALPEIAPSVSAGELLTALGLPLFHVGAKRVEGVCLGPEENAHRDVKRLRVDWPTPHGFFGSPVFNARGSWVGMVTGVDRQDTTSETPVGFVSELGSLAGTSTKTWRGRVLHLLGLHSNMPEMKVKMGAGRFISWDDFEHEACEIVQEGPSPFVFFEGKGEKGNWNFKKKNLGSYVFYGDWLAGDIENQSEANPPQLEVLLRGDESAGLWLVLGGAGAMVAVERRKGGARTALGLPDGPRVFQGNRVNLEILCAGEKVGIYFMNMPLVVVEKSGFSRGGLDFHFTGRGRQTLGRFHISIPK